MPTYLSSKNIFITNQLFSRTILEGGIKNQQSAFDLNGFFFFHFYFTGSSRVLNFIVEDRKEGQ